MEYTFNNFIQEKIFGKHMSVDSGTVNPTKGSQLVYRTVQFIAPKWRNKA